MACPVTLFTGQWVDLLLETIAEKASSWGYDGLELACWGDHFDVQKALSDDGYCKNRKELLAKYDLNVWSPGGLGHRLTGRRSTHFIGNKQDIQDQTTTASL